MYLIVGLGNPGEEYENTRHNVGRIILENFRKKNKFPEWKEDKNAQALCSQGNAGKQKIELIMPETFMNKSGKSVSYVFSKRKVKPENVIVVYDDLDLPLGKMKISFNRGSGGHKGIESIVRAIKTKEFVRVRVGVSPSTPSGKTKKPQGEKNVVEFILGKFKNLEIEKLKKVSKNVSEALEGFTTDGLQKTMNYWNSQ